MNKAGFLDLLRAADPRDLDTLRLAFGYSEDGRRPALILRGVHSTWERRPQVVICTAPPGRHANRDAAFARLETRRASEFGKWLREWQHTERGRRFRLASLSPGAA